MFVLALGLRILMWMLLCAFLNGFMCPSPWTILKLDPYLNKYVYIHIYIHTYRISHIERMDVPLAPCLAVSRCLLDRATRRLQRQTMSMPNLKSLMWLYDMGLYCNTEGPYCNILKSRFFGNSRVFSLITGLCPIGVPKDGLCPNNLLILRVWLR